MMFSETPLPFNKTLPPAFPQRLIQNQACRASTSHWQREGTSFSSSGAGVSGRWGWGCESLNKMKRDGEMDAGRT